MRILHLNSENGWRGGENQLLYLVQGLKEKAGYEQFVMCRENSLIQQWCERDNIPYTTARFRGSADFKTAIKIAKFCKEEKIDIIHAQTSHAHAASLYSKYFNNKAKLVLHRRVSFPIKNNFLSKFKYTSKHLEKVICISQGVKDVLLETTQQTEKVEVIYDSVNPMRFEGNVVYEEDFHVRYDLPKRMLNIANTAALTSEKDYETFIETADLCLKNGIDANFLIVGSGGEEEKLKSLVRQKKLENHVFFLGFIDDINDILNHIGILLVTSKMEGLGSSILDAFHKMVPVVATSAGGIPELVLHEKTGMLAPVGDSKLLAQNIQQILKDDTLKEAIKQGAKEHLEGNFMIDDMVNNVEQLYSNIL